MCIDKRTNIGCTIQQGWDWLCLCPHNLLPLVLVAQSCPIDFAIPGTVCNPPASSGHGILQARMLEWVAIPFSRRSFWPMDQTWVSHIAGRFFTVWATREAQTWLWWFIKDTTFIKKKIVLIELLLYVRHCFNNKESVLSLFVPSVIHK